ncbi:hypothetical protein JCM10207_008193 [Rhodosporidiobolus poonsookiae]
MLSRHLRTHLVVAPSTSVGKSIFSTGLVRASLQLGERVGYLKPVGTGSGDGDDELHLQRFAPRAHTACLFHFDEPVSPHLAVERAASGAAGGKSALQAPTDAQFAAAVGKYVRSWEDKTRGRRSSLYIESAGGVHSPTLSGTSQLDAFRPLLPPALLVASAALGGISTTISAYESLLLRGYDVDAVLVFREEYYQNYAYFEQWFGERGIRVGVVDPPPEQLPSAVEDAANLERYYQQLEGAPLQHVVTRLQQVHLDRLSNLATAPRRTLDQVWWPFVQHGLVKNEQDVMVIESAHGDHFNVFSTSSPPSASTPAQPAEFAAAASPVIPSSPSAAEPSSAPPPSAAPPVSAPAPRPPLTSPVFDGSASWWTQCLGHANPELTLAAAHSAGRFGHVMFPTATNLPALTLAERLLAKVGNGWASRVFFSDNGSTGMEVALKMALRAFASRERLSPEEGRKLAVLGLQGSYHGDTIGAMDACEGSVYSERVEWYEGRGAWLAAPEVRVEAGGEVVVRSGADGTRIAAFPSLGGLYDVRRRVAERDPLVEAYRTEIEAELKRRIDAGLRFGALILEPVVMGAGGMIFVDPLYQHVLIDVVRSNRRLFPSAPPASALSSPVDGTPAWTGLPVIFDEVFVGLHRLGPASTTSFLKQKPDIACYAKILTGGLVPLALTLASDAVFRAFWSNEKVDALLHGHSYTAHAVGCGVANKTLEILGRMEQQGAWDAAKKDWRASVSSPNVASASRTASSSTPSASSPPASIDPLPASAASHAPTPAFSLWSSSFVQRLASHPAVEGVMALGTVLAIHLRSPSSSSGYSYSSTAAEGVLHRLRHVPGAHTAAFAAASPTGQPFAIHARPLGNRVYFMSSLNSSPETLSAVEESVWSALEAERGGEA